MKEGDLVRRKPEWGDWTQYNPWMLTQKDMQVGMVISVNYWNGKVPRDIIVLWENGSEVLWYYDVEVCK